MYQNEEEVLEIVQGLEETPDSLQDVKISLSQVQKAEDQLRQGKKTEIVIVRETVKRLAPNLHKSSKRQRRMIMYKCKVCRSTGKKATVIMCTKCKYHFHKQCLDPQKDHQDQRTFVCQICQNSTQKYKHPKGKQRSIIIQTVVHEPSIAIKKQQNPIQKEKQQNQGFLNISKLMNIYRSNFKKEEWKRKLYEFYKKYPYCFQKNKIVFPIQDHLLHIYQSIFPSYCKTTSARPKPIYQYNEISKQIYNDLFEVEVFFSNFWEELKFNNFFKPKGKPQVFQLKLQDLQRKTLYLKLIPEGMTESFSQIFQMLLRIYLNDIMDRNRIDNMKYISSNAFFNLLATINQDQGGLTKQFIIKSAPQILKNLTKIPSFRRSFLCRFDGKQSHQIHYPKKFDYHNKMILILKLIRGLCDTDCFKQIVMKKAQQISLYTKQKGEIVLQLKSIQAQNLQLKQKIKPIQQQIKQLAFTDPKQYSKKYQVNTKKIQKLITARKTNEQKIKQFRDKIKQIQKKMPFVNSLIKFLGVDRFKSQYFFYEKERDKIYVKYRESLFSDEEDQTFMCYKNKGQIEQLKNWLNSKGTNEKGLLYNINNLQQKQIIVLAENQQKQQISSQQIIQVQQKRYIQLESLKREQNLQNLIFCQNIFKQTIKDTETIPEREKAMEQIFLKINSQVDKSKGSEEEDNIWKVLFQKYPQKMWNWNQKVKKFWFQFLEGYLTDSHLQSEGNLMILITVFKIAMKIYHNQTLKKREKNQKRRQRERILRQKEIQMLQQNQLNQVLSSEEQRSQQINELTGAENGKRLLRKRQNNVMSFKDKSESSEQDDLNHSSKKSSSNLEQNGKMQIKQPKKKKITQNSPTQKRKKQKKQNQKKKLSIQSQQESNSEEQQADNQQTQNNTKAVQNETVEPTLQQQVSPEEQFCEECFENVFYDRVSKVKIIRCQMCGRVYHKRCLEQDDAARFKQEPNEWKCCNCFNQKEDAQVKKITYNNNVDSKKKIQTKQKQNKTLKIINEKSKQAKKESKTKQKSQKKQKKKQRQQERKVQQSQSYDSEKQFQQAKQMQQAKIEINQSKKKSIKSKSKKKSKEQPANGKKKTEKKNNSKIKKQTSQQDDNASIILNSERRTTRDKNNRKKIIDQSSQQSFLSEQLNSQEESNS